MKITLEIEVDNEDSALFRKYLAIFLWSNPVAIFVPHLKINDDEERFYKFVEKNIGRKISLENSEKLQKCLDSLS